MEAWKRLLMLLTRQERRKVLGVLALATLAAVVQVFAVLAIMPFIEVLMGLTGETPGGIADRMAAWFGISSDRGLLLATGSTVFLLVLVSNLLGVLSLRQIQLAAWNTHHHLSRRLLQAYLARPYPWFLNRHSGHLGESLLEEVRLVVQGVMLPLLSAFTRGVSALFLVGLLLVVDFRLALLAGVILGTAYVLIYFGTRVIQDNLGKDRAEASRTRFQLVGDALGGIKEVKSLGAENMFVERFEATGHPYVRAVVWTSLVTEIPRFVLEVLAIATTLLIVFVLLGTGDSFQEALPKLGLFLYAGYKLVPAFQQVFAGAAAARFNLAAMDRLQGDLEEVLLLPGPAGAPIAPIRLESELKLREVEYTYPGADNPALSKVNLVIQRGERVGVVGPSGAGKTTLVDILLGLLEPDSGGLIVDGTRVSGEYSDSWRDSVGYVPQSIFLMDDSIAANIAFGTPDAEREEERIQTAAKQADIHGFIETLPDGYETRVGERGVRLSGGQRQRLGIARALHRDPTLLLFDEATSSLDVRTEQAVMASLHGLGPNRTVVIVSHRLATVRSCDRIVLLANGRVDDVGPWDDLIGRNPLFRALAASSPSEGSRV